MIIIKENVNGFNMLVTNGDINDISSKDKYNAHLWIHNNTLNKNHTSLKYNVNSFITESEIFIIKNQKQMDVIELFPNLSRAVEIALLSNLKIKIVFDNSYIGGFEDYKRIKEYYDCEMFSTDADITVEIHKPKFESFKRKSTETLDTIKSRVEKAKLNPIPTTFKNDSCESLLKSAVNKLNYSVDKYERVVNLSKYIAALEGSKFINSEHVAEAITYNLNYENHCIAENNTIMFGNGINISLHELDSGDIESAIKYLQNLIS